MFALEIFGKVYFVGSIRLEGSWDEEVVLEGSPPLAMAQVPETEWPLVEGKLVVTVDTGWVNKMWDRLGLQGPHHRGDCPTWTWR